MYRLKGFTLIELMTTLAVAGVVLAVGVPSFRTYLLNNHQTSSVNDLATALQLARNNAISRRMTVTVCKSNDGATCQTGSSSGDWSQGWMVFTNLNGDTTLDAGDDLLLRVHGALSGDATFIGKAKTANRVSFSPQGLSGNNGSLVYCDSRGARHASGLVISTAGRVRQALDNDNNGIIENGSGVDVSC